MAHIYLTPYFAYEGCRTGRSCGAQRLLKLIHWHLDVASRQDANTTIDKMEVQNHNIFRKKCIGTFLGNITIHEFITIFEMNIEKITIYGKIVDICNVIIIKTYFNTQISKRKTGMEDNEYKIKYGSIEEFCRIASGNIARWEEQLSEIEGCLNRLLNMETFQGESADAIRTYIREVHVTLLSAIRQCLREYSTRLLMYQSGYYKIDSAKGACLPEKEISDMGKHLQKQEEYLLERDQSIRSILDEISDILPLPIPSQETGTATQEQMELLHKGHWKE